MRSVFVLLVFLLGLLASFLLRDRAPLLSVVCVTLGTFGAGALALPMTLVPIGYAAILRSWNGLLEAVEGPVVVVPPWKVMEGRFWLGNRRHTFKIERVQTYFGLPLDFTITVMYRVDPSKLEALARVRLLRLDETGWHNLVGTVLDTVIRQLIPEFKTPDAEILISRETIKARLRAELAAATQGLGMTISNLLLGEITPPASWREAIINRDTADYEAEALYLRLKRLLDALNANGTDHTDQLPSILLADQVHQGKQAPNIIIGMSPNGSGHTEGLEESARLYTALRDADKNTGRGPKL